MPEGYRNPLTGRAATAHTRCGPRLGGPCSAIRSGPRLRPEESQLAPIGLIVRNARVHPTTRTGNALSDVRVDGDTIAAIAPAGSIPADGRPELDAAGRLLSPPLVDPHVHMDAVLTVGEPRHNESGTLIEGILTWAERKIGRAHV